MGVFEAKGDLSIQCLCYIRIIEDIYKHLTHALAWRFVDIDASGDGNIDAEAQEILTKLRDDRLVNALQKANIFK